MEAEWLVKDSQIVMIGRFQPEWFLRKPLLAVVEQDRMGHYLISNEGLVLYAVGFTQEEALEDFKAALISTYQFLEARAGEDPDLERLLLEYQKYLERPSSPAV
jgi:hypothetical protein